MGKVVGWIRFGCAVSAFVVMAGCSPRPKSDVAATKSALTTTNGLSQNGLTTNGLIENGFWSNGFWSNGFWSNGFWSNGFWSNGFWSNGFWSNGFWSNGFWSNGFWSNGFWSNGLDGTPNVPAQILRTSKLLRTRAAPVHLLMRHACRRVRFDARPEPSVADLLHAPSRRSHGRWDRWRRRMRRRLFLLLGWQVRHSSPRRGRKWQRARDQF